MASGGQAFGDKAALQETEDQFRVLAETLPQLVWTTRPDGYHDYFNRRWYEFTGLKAEQSIGDGWYAAVHHDDRPLAEERWRRALATGKLYEIEYRIRSGTGRYRWFLGRALPIRDASGKILRWFGTCTDIQGQKSAEEALRRLDKQHRLALEAAELGTWDYELESGTVSCDPRTCALLGLESEGIRNISFEETVDRIHEDDRAAVREFVAAALDPHSDGRYDAEYRIVLPDGSPRWLHVRGQALFEEDGPARRAIRLSGVVSDATERRTSEEARQLLTRELNHRVKNLFAIASGMVSMTARTAKSTKEMAEALRGRLGALSRAHELVRPALAAASQFGQATDFARLIETILAPYAEGGSADRLQLAGDPVPIGTNTTTSLALVLHELATNAAKYGCLSAPEGRLSIGWEICDGMLHMTWTETGGPPVTEAPSLEGFGSQLSRKSITGQLGGTLKHDWRPEGLVVHMTLALDRVAH